MFEINTIILTGDNFTFVYRTFYYRLTCFAMVRVRCRMTAEDIVTDVFIRLWQRREGFSTIQSIQAFLFISVRNACLNHIQHMNYVRREEELIRLETQISENSVMHRIIAFEMRKEVSSLLQCLPQQCLTIFRLYYYNQKSHQEIADIMELSKHTVRNQLVRGIKLMREKYRISSRINEMERVNGIGSHGKSVLATVLKCKEDQDIPYLVSNLPDENRKVIKLLFYKRLSVREISIFLNIPQVVVHGRKRRGITLMKEELKKTIRLACS